MIVFDKDNLVFFDVDDTLVMWEQPEPPEGYLKVVDPYDHFEAHLVPHKDHIRLLKRAKARNRAIVVWSHGGAKWAEKIVKALGLEKHVDLIMDKPEYYCDDHDIRSWGFINIYQTHGYGKGNKDANS